MDDKIWVTLKDGRKVLIKTTSAYMNNKIKNEYKIKRKDNNGINEMDIIKTQSGKIKFINDTYKDILRFPITAIKVKKWITGDKKTGKYDWQYDAVLKPKPGSTLSEHISTNSLEEMYNKLKSRRS